MLNVRLICTGVLKEPYLRDACREYEKRLGAYCRFETLQLKEVPLPDEPSARQITEALGDEGKKIISLFRNSSYRIALCVEGEQLSSEGFAQKISNIGLSGKSGLDLIIGSSYGLSDEVKKSCDLRLSFSKMTFPHQLMRVIAEEQLYRAMNICANGKYHK